MRNRQLLGIAFLIGVTATAPAHAYVDPNAGGLLFQLLTPLLALAAAGLTFARKQLGRAWVLIAGAVKNRFDQLVRARGREAE